MYGLKSFVTLFSFVALVFSESISDQRRLSSTYSTQVQKTLNFLVMGDWGTQTSSSKRRLDDVDPDSFVEVIPDGFEADLTLLAASNNDNNNNKNNNNNNNNNNKNSGSYWAVLVAKAMADHADKYPAHFLIALGDNFYNNGVSSTTDGLWTTLYTNVYNYDSLQVPWFAIFGNHDYGQNKNNAGSLQAQIDYEDGRWTAGYCYKKSFDIPNSFASVDIVFVDTTLIAPQETYMTSTSSGVSASEQSSRQKEQLECLEGYLKGSRAAYLVVAGHYPLYSTGKNGPGDMSTLVEILMPLLEKYNVDAYLCGHDHRLEHLVYKTSSGANMDFIISGAAGKPDNQLANGITSAAKSMFAAATGGFTFAKASESEITFDIFDSYGALLYSTVHPQTREFSGKGEFGMSDERGVGMTKKAVDTLFAYSEMSGMDKGELFEIVTLLAVFVTLLAVVFVVSAPPDSQAARVTAKLSTTLSKSLHSVVAGDVFKAVNRFRQRVRRPRHRPGSGGVTVCETLNSLREVQVSQLKNITTKVPEYSYVGERAMFPRNTIPLVVPYGRNIHHEMMQSLPSVDAPSSLPPHTESVV